MSIALASMRWGDGAACCAVLLHGVGGSRESWSDAVSGTGRALASSGVDVVAFDLPGYGASPSIEPYTMAGLAGAVAEALAGLPHERIVLVGHSMGGMVAQELMATAPDALRRRVAGLALVGTSSSFGKPGGELGRWQREFLAQRLAPLDAGLGMARLAPGLVQGMASAQAPHDAVARAAVLMAAVPEQTYRRALAAIAAFDRREALADLRLPVLCLAGSDDRNAPAAMMRAMAERIAGGRFQLLSGVGHLAHMEAPAAVNAALVAFLQTVLGRADGHG